TDTDPRAMDERSSAATPAPAADHSPERVPGPSSTLLIDQRFTLADLRSLRTAVGDHAQALGLPDERIKALELVASELITNAIEHGGGHGRLRLWASDTDVYCEISDSGSGLSLPPDRPTYDPYAPRGRGLWLASTFADSLSVDHPDAAGATVT